MEQGVLVGNGGSGNCGVEINFAINVKDTVHAKGTAIHNMAAHIALGDNQLGLCGILNGYVIHAEHHNTVDQKS